MAAPFFPEELRVRAWEAIVAPPIMKNQQDLNLELPTFHRSYNFDM